MGSAVAAATGYLALVDPNQPGHYLTCPVLAATGLYCAGCGGLRAVHDLAHLDLAGAWAMNPLLVLAAPFAVWAWARWLRRSLAPAAAGVRERAGARAAVSDRRNALLAWGVLAAVVGFSVLRNLPALAPWLAP